MGVLGWVLVGLFSAAPCVLPALGESLGAWVPAGSSLLGLALLPWLALIGLPVRGGEPELPALTPAVALFPLAVALPGLGLAAGLDLARERLDVEATLLYLLGGLALMLLWRLSAVSGARRPSAGRAHLWLWGLMLPLSSTAVCALAWAPPGLAEEETWLGLLNPLVWCLEFSGHEALFGSMQQELGRLALLLAAAALSWGLTSSLARGGRR